jgi:hypothetical protein
LEFLKLGSLLSSTPSSSYLPVKGGFLKFWVDSDYVKTKIKKINNQNIPQIKFKSQLFENNWANKKFLTIMLFAFFVVLFWRRCLHISKNC